MGMNTVIIDILPQGIEYLYSNGVWKFEGNSNISYEMVVKTIRKLRLKKIGEDYYTDKKTIDLRILRRADELKAIRVECMVRCIDDALEVCYSLAHSFSDIFSPRFCVLGENIEFGQYENYVNAIKLLYSEKILWCENSHLKDFSYVVPPHKFNKMYERYSKTHK